MLNLSYSSTLGGSKTHIQIYCMPFEGVNFWLSNNLKCGLIDEG